MADENHELTRWFEDSVVAYRRADGKLAPLIVIQVNYDKEEDRRKKDLDPLNDMIFQGYTPGANRWLKRNLKGDKIIHSPKFTGFRNIKGYGAIYISRSARKVYRYGWNLQSAAINYKFLWKRPEIEIRHPRQYIGENSEVTKWRDFLESVISPTFFSLNEILVKLEGERTGCLAISPNFAVRKEAVIGNPDYRNRYELLYRKKIIGEVDPETGSIDLKHLNFVEELRDNGVFVRRDNGELQGQELPAV